MNQNRQVVDTFWYFVQERQRILERRVEGRPAPWTKDPILQDNRFCNTFRAADRECQYLIRSIQYSEEAEQSSLEDIIFRTVAFRLFSKHETWERITECLIHQPTVHDLASGEFLHALEWADARLGTLYTSSFMLCGVKSYGPVNRKYETHERLLRHMFVNDELGKRIQDLPSMQDTAALLAEYPLIGRFMSYQIATDINYSTATDFDEDEYVLAGPGAVRGIEKMYGGRPRGRTYEDVIRDLRYTQLSNTDSSFLGLYGRPLQLIDIQNCLCETDKYLRASMPELSPGKRIKRRYHRNFEPLSLFFPPKWGINRALPQNAAL